MKKVILSMIFMFAVTTFVNATNLADRNCVEVAMAAGDDAEADGFTYAEAYEIAINEYSKCTGEPVQ